MVEQIIGAWTPAPERRFGGHILGTPKNIDGAPTRGGHQTAKSRVRSATPRLSATRLTDEMVR